MQNAGYKQAATDAFDIAAKQTLKINFWGTLNMMKRKLMPLTVTVILYIFFTEISISSVHPHKVFIQ